MTRIRDLPPPIPEVDENESTNTWDSTYRPNSLWGSSDGQLCPHAVAHDQYVWGINTESFANIWQAKLDGIVSNMASNSNGTVLAVSTETGKVFLFNSSGKILANRDFRSSKTRFVWISDSILLIEITKSTSSSNNVLRDSLEDHHHLSSDNIHPNTNALTIHRSLVSNIRGDLLNSNDDAIIAEASRSMHISVLTEPSFPTVTGVVLRNSSSSDSNDDATRRIRFVGCNADEEDGDDGNKRNQVCITDYDMATSKVIQTQTNEVQLNDHDNEIVLDSSVQWVTQTALFQQQQQQRSFVVLTGYRDGGGDGTWRTRRSCLFWLDVEDPKNITSYSLSQKSTFLKVESLPNIDKALALAVAEKDSHSIRIQIVQVHIHDERTGQSDSTNSLSRPHVVYTIPVYQTTTSILSSTLVSLSICSIPNPQNMYAFRYKLQVFNKNRDESTDGGENVYYYREFSSPVAKTIGKIRGLLACNEWDAAEKILPASTDPAMEELVNEPFANFHPSEVALQRLQAVVTTASVLTTASTQELNETLIRAQDCIRQLAVGATTSSKGMDLFVEAIDCVIRSPICLTMDKYIVGLSMVSTTIQKVKQTLEEDDVTKNKLQQKNEKVERQIAALQMLSKLMSNDASEEGTNVSPLETPFYKIRSISHLFAILIRERKFDWAEQLHSACTSGVCAEELTTETIIVPILELKSDVHPESIALFLHRVVVPSLTINHPLLSRLKAWVCRLADDLDDSTRDGCNNLEAAILLLKTMERGICELQVKIHSSFASFSPFAQFNGHQSRRSPRGINSSESEGLKLDNFNFSGELSFSSGSATTNTLRLGLRAFAEGQCVPTILELSLLKKGSAIRKFSSSDCIEYDDYYEERDDCVRDKLREAICLRDVRNLGLDSKQITLRHFERKGGVQIVAKELVSFYSASASCHDERAQVFTEKLVPFCKTHSVSMDQAMFDCTIELCRGKNISENAIAECCSIARCCTSVIVRCHVVLAVLRAALLCDSVHSNLSLLASDAIAWASCDSNLQSELEEAARILQIDNIVVKYCGAGARELFRVDNPRHAIRLLEFVTKQIERESVVDDALSLCDAFHHLSALNATRALLQHAITRHDPDLCVKVISKIIEKDATLAETSLLGAIAFADEILSECSRAIRADCNFERLRRYRSQSRQVSACASALLLCALENSLQVSQKAFAEIDCHFVGDPSLKSIRDLFLRIEKLQREHLIFVSLAECAAAKTALRECTHFVKDVAACHTTNERSLLNRKLSTAKRVCNLFVGDSNRLHSKSIMAAVSAGIALEMVREHKDENLIGFFSCMGLLQNSEVLGSLFGSIHLSTALALCVESANFCNQSDPIHGMHRIITAASLLSDWSLSLCQGKLLPGIVTLSGHLGVLLLLFSRIDVVGETLDRVRQTQLSIAWTMEEGSFGKCSVVHAVKEDQSDLRGPSLHTSWYVGDGLLLPRDETFVRCIRYCKGLTNARRGLNDGSIEIYQLSGGRGAHSIALRALCTSIAIHGCSDAPSNETSFQVQLLTALGETNKALAERSLGGTNAGITSAVIDSQLAVCFLLHLPTKHAFHVYRSGIPNSFKTQNFARLLSLSNIGMLAVSGDAKLGKGGMFAIGWKNQDRFFEQCRQLSAKATWWAILRRFGVDFDIHCFQEVVPSGESENSGQQGVLRAYSKYAASLMPQLIAKMSMVLDTASVLRMALLYSEIFGLPSFRVYECHVELSLCPPGKEPSHQFDLAACEKTVRASLRKLASPQKRFLVLRKSIIALESSMLYSQEYERHFLALSLYYEAIAFLLERDPAVRSINSEHYELELDLVGRRKDALSILSSFFRAERRTLRPDFTKFFPPFPEKFSDNCSKTRSQSMCGILGRESDDEFDPLAPLQKVLSDSLDAATVTALAPLCFPLGIPNGYVHARALLARFQHARNFNVPFPSFESDVQPVLNRIRSSTDRAILAQWCARQYEKEAQQALMCFDVVLQDAILAADDIEQKLLHSPQNKNVEELEARMYETIKQVTAAKAKLSDLLRVKTVLASTKAAGNRVVDKLRICLMNEVESFSDGMEGPSPESIVDFLYEKGSLLAANACLNKEDNFSIQHFRSFCSVVHSACYAVADQNSHINPAVHSKRLRERWLFFGDESHKVGDSEARLSSGLAPLLDIDEDDTLNFVMDLSGMQSHVNDVATLDSGIEVTLGKKIVSEEEPSALYAKSAREISEHTSQRTALRIAFVMAYGDEHNEQNKNAFIENDISSGQSTQTKKRLGMLKKLETKRNFKRDHAFELGNELVQIVFASGNKLPTTIVSRRISSVSDTATKPNSTKPVTFSMRHRALRAASILCPQEILEEIVAKEGFLQGESQMLCTLRQCTFGTFLAKEIEEMGLPLPHSDLWQLSSMNFPAYARALWRHHRDTNMTCKGRLLLLLVELSVKGEDADIAFISNLLDEMLRLNLSRTLLLSIEQIVYNMDRCQETISKVGRDAVTSLSLNIYGELSRNIHSAKNGTPWGKVSSAEAAAVVDTIQRLYKLLTVLCSRDDVSKFVTALISLENRDLSTFLSRVFDEEKMIDVFMSARSAL